MPIYPAPITVAEATTITMVLELPVLVSGAEVNLPVSAGLTGSGSGSGSGVITSTV